MLKSKPKAGEAFYASMVCGHGKTIRLIALLTADGWLGGVLDEFSDDWFSVGEWSDLAEAKLNLHEHAKLAFRVIDEAVWLPGTGEIRQAPLTEPT
jgi:hypothetical protein